MAALYHQKGVENLMIRDPFVTQLADTCKALFGKKNTDPNAKEIATALYDAELPERWVDDIRDHLLRVRDALEEDGLVIQLMSQDYYKSHRESVDIADDEARRCIPLGKPAEGIRLVGIMNDPYWKAGVEQSIKSGNGKVKKSEERVLTQFQKGKLTEESTATLLRASQQQRQLENPILVEKIIGYLDKESEC